VTQQLHKHGLLGQPGSSLVVNITSIMSSHGDPSVSSVTKGGYSYRYHRDAARVPCSAGHSVVIDAGHCSSRAAGQQGSRAAGQQGSRAAGQQGSRAAGCGDCGCKPRRLVMQGVQGSPEHHEQGHADGAGRTGRGRGAGSPRLRAD